MNFDDYAILMYIGPASMGGKREYWITFGGHAHSQPRTGLTPGTLGTRRGHNFE